MERSRSLGAVPTALSLSVLLLAAGAARAQEPVAEPAPAAEASPAPPPATSWTDQVTLNAFLSVGFTHNWNSPASHGNQVRVFDFDEGSFKPDVFEVVLQKPASAAGDVGFRADLTVGSSVPRIAAARGLFRDVNTGVAQDFDLQQATVSWIAPVGKGLRVDVGKFVTHAGAELIEGYDGWNEQYSRSILFGYAIPFTHTGVKAGYAFSDKVTAAAMIVNGWDNVQDNNGGKTLGAQLVVTPIAPLSVYLNFLNGAERDGNDDDSRRLFDVVAIYKPTDRLTFTLNWDHGTDENGAADGDDATWSGIAAYARFKASDALAFGVRGERFSDDDGVRTGLAQDLWEVTLTPEYKVNDRFLIRGDLRFDGSSEHPFLEDEESFTDRQLTTAVNVIYSF